MTRSEWQIVGGVLLILLLTVLVRFKRRNARLRHIRRLQTERPREMVPQGIALSRQLLTWWLGAIVFQAGLVVAIDHAHLAGWWDKTPTLVGVFLCTFFDYVLAGAMQLTIKPNTTSLLFALYLGVYLTLLAFFTLVGISAGDPLLKQSELFLLFCVGVTFMTLGLVACVWSNEVAPPNRAPLDWRDLSWRRVTLATMLLGPGLLILPATSFALLLIYHAQQPGLLPTIVCIVTEILLCFVFMFVRRPSRLAKRGATTTL